MSPNVGLALCIAAAAVVVAAFLGLLIWSAAWAYRDAEERGKPGWLVALLVVVLKWPASLLAWLAFRPRRLNDGDGKPAA